MCFRYLQFIFNCFHRKPKNGPQFYSIMFSMVYPIIPEKSDIFGGWNGPIFRPTPGQRRGSAGLFCQPLPAAFLRTRRRSLGCGGGRRGVRQRCHSAVDPVPGMPWMEKKWLWLWFLWFSGPLLQNPAAIFWARRRMADKWRCSSWSSPPNISCSCATVTRPWTLRATPSRLWRRSCLCPRSPCRPLGSPGKCMEMLKVHLLVILFRRFPIIAGLDDRSKGPCKL